MSKKTSTGSQNTVIIGGGKDNDLSEYMTAKKEHLVKQAANESAKIVCEQDRVSIEKMRFEIEQKSLIANASLSVSKSNN